MHYWIVLKEQYWKFTLKFTFKQLRNVSVLQLHHHHEALPDDVVTVTPKQVGAVLM